MKNEASVKLLALEVEAMVGTVLDELAERAEVEHAAMRYSRKRFAQLADGGYSHSFSRALPWNDTFFNEPKFHLNLY